MQRVRFREQTCYFITSKIIQKQRKVCTSSGFTLFSHLCFQQGNGGDGGDDANGGGGGGASGGSNILSLLTGLLGSSSGSSSGGGGGNGARNDASDDTVKSLPFFTNKIIF